MFKYKLAVGKYLWEMMIVGSNNNNDLEINRLLLYVDA